jgi:large subunit ribosomal protein L2
MPIGTIIHNVELKPGKGGQIARSAGCYVQLVGRDAGWAISSLKSGERAAFWRHPCMATSVRCPTRITETRSTTARPAARAGRASVRSCSRCRMNPIDHPHGEGRTSVAVIRTPWGKPTKGKRTRSNKSTDKYIVRSRTRNNQRKKRRSG